MTRSHLIFTHACETEHHVQDLQHDPLDTTELNRDTRALLEEHCAVEHASIDLSVLDNIHSCLNRCNDISHVQSPTAIHVAQIAAESIYHRLGLSTTFLIVGTEALYYDRYRTQAYRLALEGFVESVVKGYQRLIAWIKELIDRVVLAFNKWRAGLPSLKKRFQKIDAKIKNLDPSKRLGGSIRIKALDGLVFPHAIHKTVDVWAINYNGYNSKNIAEHFIQLSHEFVEIEMLQYRFNTLVYKALQQADDKFLEEIEKLQRHIEVKIQEYTKESNINGTLLSGYRKLYITIDENGPLFKIEIKNDNDYDHSVTEPEIDLTDNSGIRSGIKNTMNKFMKISDELLTNVEEALDELHEFKTVSNKMLDHLSEFCKKTEKLAKKQTDEPHTRLTRLLTKSRNWILAYTQFVIQIGTHAIHDTVTAATMNMILCEHVVALAPPIESKDKQFKRYGGYTGTVLYRRVLAMYVDFDKVQKVTGCGDNYNELLQTNIRSANISKILLMAKCVFIAIDESKMKSELYRIDAELLEEDKHDTNDITRVIFVVECLFSKLPETETGSAGGLSECLSNPSKGVSWGAYSIPTIEPLNTADWLNFL